MEGGDEKANRLSEAVKRSMKEVTVVKTQKESTIVILDIDAVTTEAEVKEAIMDNLKLPEEEKEAI